MLIYCFQNRVQRVSNICIKVVRVAISQNTSNLLSTCFNLCFSDSFVFNSRIKWILALKNHFILVKLMSQLVNLCHHVHYQLWFSRYVSLCIFTICIYLFIYFFDINIFKRKSNKKLKNVILI